MVAISIVVGMVVIILNHHFSFDGKDRPGIEDYDVQVVIDNVKIDDYNKFNLGDEVEILSPVGEPVVMKVSNLYNDKNEEIETANHAMMKFYIKTDLEFPKNSIIRMKK